MMLQTRLRLTLFQGRFKLNFQLWKGAQAMQESVDPRRLKLTNDEGTEGVLLGFRCLECNTVIFGPGTFCQRCTSDKLDPMEFSQTGTLYSYTVVRVPPAGWPGPVPYILGQVELPEGPQVLAELVDCQEGDLEIGMPVELTLRLVEREGSSAGKVVYKWRPANSGSSYAEVNP